MKEHNPVVWFEIYVKDMNRATSFYETVLQVTLEDMSDPTDSNMLMKGFPGHMESYGAPGALVKMEGFEPSAAGSIIYFGCEDCGTMADRSKKAGGKVHTAKMGIGEHGFVSLVHDTEGNTIGFHSMK